MNMKLIAAAIVLPWLLGCQVAPIAPGGIVRQSDTLRWGVSPAHMFPDNPDRRADAQAMMMAFERVLSQTAVIQPENPAGAATLTVGDASAVSPATYKPPIRTGAVGSGSPTDRALGGLVWVGGALVLLGLVGVGLRLLPWTAGFGAVVPIGLCVLLGLGGGLLIALATVLAAAPWWMVGLCIAGVVAVGLYMAMRDNLGKLAAKSPPPTDPAPSLRITG